MTEPVPPNPRQYRRRMAIAVPIALLTAFGSLRLIGAFIPPGCAGPNGIPTCATGTLAWALQSVAAALIAVLAVHAVKAILRRVEAKERARDSKTGE